MFKKIILLIGILLLSSCIKENILSATTIPICNLNSTPTLFLYPALDSNSDIPTFFNITEYEIMREGKYLGKFEGNRLNYSFLNLTYNDKLDIIVSALDKKCYVSNTYFEYFVDCKPIQYINPELHCANKFDIDIRDGEYNKLENNSIKSNINIVELKLRFFEKPEDWIYFGCNYDRNYVEKTILKTSTHLLFEEYNKIQFAFKRNYYDLYKLEYDYDYYLIISLNNGKLYKSFNTSIYCTFFDTEWFIEDYAIRKKAVDKNLNDLGQPNPTFNFTIHYTP